MSRAKHEEGEEAINNRDSTLDFVLDGTPRMSEAPLVAKPSYDTINDAYRKIGGFGLFQYLAATVFILGYNTGGFLFYNLSLLELKPKYFCTNTANPSVEYPCKAVDFCGNSNITHRIDWDDKTSLHNWVETLDLTCTPGSRVGLLGSMFFIGLAAAAIVLPRLSDMYGRKRIYFVAMVAHLAVYLVFLLSTSLTLNIVMMFIFGSLYVVRASIGYIFMQEFTPVAQQSIVGTLLQIITGSLAPLACVYFYYISPWWRPF